MSKRSQHTGVALVFFSAILFGSYGVWSRLIGDAMGNFYQGWTRGLMIAVLLLPVVLARKEFIKFKQPDVKWLLLFLFFTSLTQAPIFYAFNHMDIGTASLLFFVTMFLTMNLVGVIFLGESLNTTKIIAALLAVIGMYLVFSFSVAAFVPLAALMAIVNGIASGGEVAFSKKLSDNYSPLYLCALSWLVILMTNGVLSLLFQEPQVLPSWSLPWLWQVGYSVAALFGFWLVIAGFKRVDAGIGALIGLLEIVFSIVFGVLIFKEQVSLSVGVGAVLIMLAAALPHLRRSQSRDKSIFV